MKMVERIKENTKTTRSTATVFTHGLMERFTMVAGKKASSMARPNSLTPLAKAKLGFGKMASARSG